MSTRSQGRAILASLLGLLVWAALVDAADYSFTKFEVPFPGADQPEDSIVITGINNVGQLVGCYHEFAGSRHGCFIDDRGVFSVIDFPFPDSPEGALSGINDQGRVIGYYDSFPGGNCCARHSFTYEQGTFSPLDVPFPGVTGTTAEGINNLGHIVGGYADGEGFHGFLLDRGVFTVLDVAPDDINDDGQMVGSYMGDDGMIHGFTIKGGIFHTLDAHFPDVSETRAIGINNRGQIVGGYNDSAGGHGFLLEQGVFTSVDVPFPNLGSSGTILGDITDEGQIVGSYADSGGGGHAFIATPRMSLAPDSDFESDPAPFYFSRGPCAFDWTSDESHSATHALKILSETSALCRWLSVTNAIAVNPGESYDVSAWMRTEGAQPAGVLSVKFWTAAQVHIPGTIYAPQALSGPRDWTQLSLSTTAPPDAAFLRVELRLNGPGTLWADDVSVAAGPPVAKSPPVVKGFLEEGETLRTTLGQWTGTPSDFQIQWIACSDSCVDILDATATSYTLTAAEIGKSIQTRVRATGFGRTGEAVASLRGPVLQAAPASGNLARDVDVELDPAAYYFTNGPCTFNWATDAALSATHALEIDSRTNALCRWFTRPTLIKVDPGTRYRVSAWLQAQDVRGNGRLALNFWTKAAEYVAPTIVSSRTVKGTQSWTQIEAQAVAPPGAAYLRVEFRLNGPGTLWADDLSVTR